MPTATRRIAIGFQGGQVLGLRVTDEELRTLSKARLDLAQVVYVRSESDELRVGFGA